MFRIALRKFVGRFVLAVCAMGIGGALPLRADDEPSKPFTLLGLDSNSLQAGDCDSGACGGACCNDCCECRPWQGFYVGGDIGYVWGQANTSVDPLPSAARFVNLLPQNIDVHPRGLLAGAHAGYNVQRNWLVFGVEADFRWGEDVANTTVVSPIIQNNGTPFPTGFISTREEIRWLSTVRGRAGVASNCAFLYFTGGLAFGNVEYSATIDPRPVGTITFPTDFNHTKFGYCLGGGVEIRLSRHWSWKNEYLFYDLGSDNAIVNGVPPNPPFQVRYGWITRGNTINSALSYKF